MASSTASSNDNVPSIASIALNVSLDPADRTLDIRDVVGPLRPTPLICGLSVISKQSKINNEVMIASVIL